MKLAGGHHDIIRQRLAGGSVQSINTYWVGIKIYAEFERVVMGLDDWARFITKVYEAYDRYIKDTVYETMVKYANELTGLFKKTGTVTAQTLNELCDLVSTATGMHVMIMGTRAALAKVTALQNSEYISDAMKNEHYRNGVLGAWEGKTLVEIPQVFKKGQVGEYKIDNTLLWIMPVAEEKFIKVVNEGDTQLMTVTDKDANMDMTYEYELQTKLGCAVMLNGVFGCYDITA